MSQRFLLVIEENSHDGLVYDVGNLNASNADHLQNTML